MKILQHLWTPILGCIGAMVFAASAHASIYTQAPDHSNGRASDFAFPAETADDFVLAASATVNSVSWTGGYDFGSNTPPPLGTDAFTISFFTDAGGAPATSAFASYNVGGNVNRVDTGFDIVNFDEYSYQVAIPNTSFAAGTTYYMSIVNDTTGAPANTGIWFWASGTGPNTLDWLRNSIGSGPWSQFGSFSHSFTLHGGGGNPGAHYAVDVCRPGLVFWRAAATQTVGLAFRRGNQTD